MAEQYKRRRGDRKDGRLLRELDSLHYITGIIYPNRCDNEAYIGLRVDLTPINEYLKRKNEGEELSPIPCSISSLRRLSRPYAAAEAEPLYRQLQLLPAQ